jgi:hypothetical protein
MMPLNHLPNSYAPDANFALHFAHSQTPFDFLLIAVLEHAGHGYFFPAFFLLSEYAALIFFPYPTGILSPILKNNDHDPDFDPKILLPRLKKA